MKKKIIFLIIAAAMCALTLTACKKNAGSETQTIDFGEWQLTTSPTCETDGEETRVSKSDSTLIETRTITATGHIWGEPETVTEPSCSVAGVQKVICKTCSNFDMRPIAALGHDWDEWEILIAPTCTSSGVETVVCKRNDSHTDIRSVDALGHDFGEWVVTTAPTCETEGEETRFCRNDNGHIETHSAAALGHDFSEWVTLTAPTETTDGEEMRACRNDKNHNETRALYATGTEGLLFQSINDGKEFEIKGYEGISESVFIPAYYNRIPITAIRTYAFYSNQIITGILFSDNSLIASIGSNAFRSCYNLESVKLPASIEVIDTAAFAWCRKLKSINIPAGVKILSTGAFGRCESLESVTFEDNSRLESILNSAFIYCFSLVSIEIPASVTFISGTVFSWWTDAQTIYLKGFSSEEEANAACESRWKDNCNANIIYQG